MPDLLLFAPCDKVIIDEQTKTLSLISVFENLDVPDPPPSERESFLIAMQWYVVTIWYPGVDEAPAQYEETSDLIAPDGTVKMTLRHDFRLGPGSHRNVMRVFGFPGVRGGGIYSLRLYLRRADTDEDRKPIARYPLSLRFTSEPK